MTSSHDPRGPRRRPIAGLGFFEREARAHEPARFDRSGGRFFWLAAQHADTPAQTFLDSLGREVISIAHNKYHDSAGDHDEKYLTYIQLDAEGKPLWVLDPRGNRVMQYINPFKVDGMAEDVSDGVYAPCNDIAGNLLFQHSMDGGDRWMLPDAAGQPLYAWDSLDRIIRTDYDPLRRPVRTFLSESGGANTLAERVVYGEGHPQAADHNLRGQVYLHFDGAGLLTNEGFDFKGNLLSFHSEA